MKANEFVKKFGWEKVKRCKNPSSRDNFFIICGDVIRDQNLEDLKHLVESYELVQSYGGLDKARSRCFLSMHVSTQSLKELQQAILDVESCQ